MALISSFASNTYLRVSIMVSCCRRFAALVLPGKASAGLRPQLHAAAASRLVLFLFASVLCGLCSAHAGTVHIDPKARPVGPNGLRARALSPTTVELRWQDTADTERWFRIEYLKGEKIENEKGGYKFKALAHCGANTTTFRSPGI
jgi:hypothetical protein